MGQRVVPAVDAAEGQQWLRDYYLGHVEAARGHGLQVHHLWQRYNDQHYLVVFGDRTAAVVALGPRRAVRPVLNMGRGQGYVLGEQLISYT